MSRRLLLILAALVAALVYAPTGAQAVTWVIDEGDTKTELRRPGVTVDTWDAATVPASAERPAGLVVAWTEVSPVNGQRGQWWWRTYTAWCFSGQCSQPVQALVKKRTRRKTREGALRSWDLELSPDVSRNRAVVKAGINTGDRWAVTDPERLVARGASEAYGRGGEMAITHTPDGRDWITWHVGWEPGTIRVAEARDGARLQGMPVRRATGQPVAAGDSQALRYVGGRWILVWSETFDSEGWSPIKIKTAPTLAQLNTARSRRLARLGDIGRPIQILGPDDGPVFAVWRAYEFPGGSKTGDDRYHGVWVNADGTMSKQQRLPRGIPNEISPVPGPSGSLALCPLSVAAPLGGPFKAAPGACPSEAVRIQAKRVNGELVD